MGIVVRIVDNSPAFLALTQKAVSAGVEAAAEQLAKTMKDTLSRKGLGGGGIGSGAGGVMPSSPGSAPAYQRGALHRSIKSSRATVTGTRISATAGTDKLYGASLDKGFTATAKGGALLIPLQPEAYRLLESGRVRGNPNIFPIKRAGKPTILARANGRGSIVPLFVLKKSVTIQPRPWVRPSLNAARAAMAEAFLRASREAGRSAA